MFEVLWEFSKYDRDAKWANNVGKMVLIVLLSAELLQTFYLKNAVCAKCNKWNITKQVAPIEKEEGNIGNRKWSLDAFEIGS